MARRLTSSTFVGRAAELAVLEAALERAAAGRPAAVFVAGESGIGKTRLLAELEARAGAREARILRGHCLELGGVQIPYAPLVAALRPIARDGAELTADLPAATRNALGELLPELGGTVARRAPTRSTAPARAGSSRRCSRCSSGSAATRPVLLLLEDVHWADSSTRDFITFLVRSAREESLCLVVTYRSDELHRRHPLRPLLAELERVPGVERIALERFDRDEVVEQLEGILQEPVAGRPRRPPVRALAGQRALHGGAARRQRGRRRLAAARDAARRAAHARGEARPGRRRPSSARPPCSTGHLPRPARGALRPRRRARHGGRARGRRPPGAGRGRRRHLLLPPRAGRRGDPRRPAPGRGHRAAPAHRTGARGAP